MPETRESLQETTPMASPAGAGGLASASPERSGSAKPSDLAGLPVFSFERPPVGSLSPAAAALTAEDLVRCTQVLEAAASDVRVLDQLLSESDRIRLLIAAGAVIRPDKHVVRRRLKDRRIDKRKQREERDRVVRADTEIRMARRDAVFVPPPQRLIESLLPEGAAAQARAAATASGRPRRLEKPRDCYVCKREFADLHFFYDAMCPECAELNYAKRFQTARLDGKVALITGARLKIGYQAALMMLRAGATVIVSTRFPQDAAIRYTREPDFPEWKDRLRVHGLDLRHSPSVEIFCRYLEQTCDRLDLLINNAAQTVRRPPGFYAHLMEIEAKPLEDLPPEARPLLRDHVEARAALSGRAPDAENTRWLADWHRGRGPAPLGLTESAALSQIPYKCDELEPAAIAELFPAGRLDADLQQVDLRSMNSWRMTLADVPTAEMLEVQLVNSVAPFILCSKLKPLMLRKPWEGKHIVNVSAMEGKFNRRTKTDKHPHTNMAKAALNMLTLTSARDYIKSGIHMNAVDTGWVTDEDPAQISARKQEELDFQPPLDIVDGAARVCDPFFAGLLTGQHSWGCFLKDYKPTEW